MGQQPQLLHLLVVDGGAGRGGGLSWFGSAWFGLARFGLAPREWHASNVYGPRFDTLCLPCRIDRVVSSIKAACGPSRNVVTCPSGGIGRRAWFRSMYPQGCGGSSPFFGTTDCARPKNQAPSLKLKNS